MLRNTNESCGRNYVNASTK